MARGRRLLLWLLPPALFCVLAGLGAREDSRTRDEAPFLHYGLLTLSEHVARNQRFNSKLPVTSLHALPVAVIEKTRGERAFVRTPDGNWAMAEWPLSWGRAVGVLLGAALVVTIGLAARSIGGERAGVAASLFAALEPNLLAHFHLVTADGGATLTAFLTALATRRFVRSRTLGGAALLGAALGLTLLCKFQLIAWALLAILVTLLARACSLRRAVVALATLLIVLDAGFFFRGLPGRWPAPPRSHKISIVESVMGRPPLPVPEDWLSGLDWTAGDEERGDGFGNLYLLGETQSHPRRGWVLYYVVALLLKLPLAVILLVGIAIFTNRADDFWAFRVFVLGFLLFLSLANHAQIGVRHALPVLPLLLVESGVAYARLERTRPWVARALVVWLALSVASFAPDFVPYTNELIVDRKRAYRALADSNLDWGQASRAARDYLTAHPDVAFEPAGPVPGKVLVSVNALVGVTEPPEKYAWLRARRPLAHVRHAYLLFEDH